MATRDANKNKTLVPSIRKIKTEKCTYQNISGCKTILIL